MCHFRQLAYIAWVRGTAPVFSLLRLYTGEIQYNIFKTWLRSTMTQTRLNSVAVFHVHQGLLDACDLDKVIELIKYKV